MSRDNPTIIADAHHHSAARRVWLVVFAASLVAGAIAAWYVASLGLTLSHYDARGHLVVSRRVVDSLTPGWRQFGAVWLPLPHLLNALPSQWDWAYRSGAVAVALSIGVLSAGLAAVARGLYLRTRSIPIALAPAVFTLLNANVLYLQGTPMTEPLLIGLSLLAYSAVDAWVDAPDRAAGTRAAWLLAALVMTRYEGWLIASGLLVIATIATRHRGARAWLPLWIPPTLTVVAFLTLGFASTGEWVWSASFFVPENPALHDPMAAARQVIEGLQAMTSSVLIVAAAVGAIVVIVRARQGFAHLLPLTLALSGLLPFVAFYSGHPLRVRYMVPLIAASGVLAAHAFFALPRRIHTLILLGVLSAVLWTRPPWDRLAPMVVEAQWETPHRVERQRVTAALAALHDGTPVMASMGSLAHYMHEASTVGLNLRDFLHEGNGDLWIEALRSPRRTVHWVLIEERAEGGDALAVRARSNPDFLAGFEPVANGGGLVLYGRVK